MSLRGQITVTSLAKAINKSKSTGFADLTKIMVYRMYYYYLIFAQNTEEYADEHTKLRDAMERLKQRYSQDICNYKGISPKTVSSSDLGKTTVQLNQGVAAPTASNFTVSTIVSEPLQAGGSIYDTYKFKKADFKAVYSSLQNRTEPDYVIILRNKLTNGIGLKKTYDNGDVDTYGYSLTGEVIIPFSDLENWAIYAYNPSGFVHTVDFKFQDVIGAQPYDSNKSILTIDRSSSSNQPPTVGDAFVTVDNNVTTVITTAMVTSGLTPAYSDPEGDPIDAIRIKEISTANQGVFYYDGVPLAEGDVISKTDLDAGKFTHVGPDVSTVTSDVIRFEVRDSVSLKWVE